MKSILQELAHSSFSPEGRKYKKGSLYEQAVAQGLESEKKLLECLDEEAVRLFNQYCDHHSRFDYLSDTENFIYGFAFGMHLAVELFQNTSPITGTKIIDD